MALTAAYRVTIGGFLTWYWLELAVKERSSHQDFRG